MLVDRERVYNNISNIQREILVDRERVYNNISNIRREMLVDREGYITIYQTNGRKCS